MAPAEARRFVVRGRVQGVGFRWWTRGRAEELGLVGTVRNRADGAVEVLAAGPAEAMDRFRTLLERGPAPARVDRVEEEAVGDVPGRDGFRIVR